MNTLTWLLLCLALVSLPAPRAISRAAVLASRGRLGGPLTAPRSGERMRALRRQLFPRQQLTRRRQALRDAVRLMVSELEAGSSTPAVLLSACDVADADHRDAFRAAAEDAARGESAGAVFARGTPMLRPLGAAWAVADQAGIAPAEVLERVAADLDAELEHERAVSVALAGPRSSSMLLACLPVLGMLLGIAMGARPIAFLAGSGGGHLVGGLGVLFDLAGILWTQQLIRRALR